MTPAIWSGKDKEDMRQVAELHMYDLGYRLVWSVDVDSVGDDIETWTQAARPTRCGLETHRGREYKEEMTITTYEMTIRVPHDLDINQKDKFLITRYRGDPVNWQYELVTPIQQGMTAIRFGVRKIEH